MDIKLEDFPNRCRCCLAKNVRLQPLFGAYLEEMLHCLVSIKAIKGDKYPQQVCTRCILKLSSAYSFRRTIISSHQILTQVVEKLLEPEDTIKSGKNETNLVQSNDTQKTITVEVINENLGTNLKSSSENSQNNVIKLEICVKEEANEEFSDEESTAVQLNENSEMGWCKTVTTSEEILVTCTHCDENFENNVDLKIHTLREHKDKCSECGVPLADVSRHSHPHQDGTNECLVCDRRFAYNSSLERHIKTHTEQERKDFKEFHLCNYCGKKFKWKSSLNKHVRYHTGKNLHICKICSKNFLALNSLKIHMLQHSGVKPFKCVKCQRTFSQQSSLNRHMPTHADERPFQCDHCLLAFKKKDILKVHLRKHTGERPYKCAECPKTFPYRKSYQVHIQSHINQRNKLELFKQRAEEDSANKKSKLNVAFLCMICEDKFSTAALLKEHSKLHVTDIEPATVQCKICEQTYINTNDLLSHYRASHEVKAVLSAGQDGRSINLCLKQLIVKTVDSSI